MGNTIKLAFCVLTLVATGAAFAQSTAPSQSTGAKAIEAAPKAGASGGQSAGVAAAEAAGTAGGGGAGLGALGIPGAIAGGVTAVGAASQNNSTNSAPTHSK